MNQAFLCPVGMPSFLPLSNASVARIALSTIDSDMSNNTINKSTYHGSSIIRGVIPTNESGKMNRPLRPAIGLIRSLKMYEAIDSAGAWRFSRM